MYTKNLDNWSKGKATESCYLPGNYFNKVFENYPGLIRDPLEIKIRKRRNAVKKYVHLKMSSINTGMPGLLRVTIDADNMRHSNLLILDYENGIVHRFEPLGKSAPYFAEVNELIEDYLNAFFDLELEVIDADFSAGLCKNDKCDNSGFCVAYTILYAYCFVNKKDCPLGDIRKFARKIEDTYGPIPEHEREVAYGRYDDDRGKKLAIGGVGGLAAGALLGVPLLGAAVGLGAGSLL